MDISDLLAVLPGEFATGAVLIIVVSAAIVAFRPFHPSEEPPYVKLLRAAVSVMVLVAFAILIVVGIYLVISATIEGSGQRESVAAPCCPSVLDKQNHQLAEGNQPCCGPYRETHQPGPAQAVVPRATCDYQHYEGDQHNGATGEYRGAQPTGLVDDPILPVENNHNPTSLNAHAVPVA